MATDLLTERFLKVVEENVGIVLKISRTFASCQQDREDLTNDITLELWKSFRKFKGDSKVSTWVYKVALNTAMNFNRKKSKHSFVSFFDDVRHTEMSDWLIEPVYETASETDILYSCIDELNEIDKAFILLYLDGKSHEEIAEISGISKTNVGTRIGRIKEVIKNLATSKK